MKSTTREQIAKWLGGPFLKVDPQAWQEVGKAAFTLAAMVHVAGMGNAAHGLYYGRPKRLCDLLGYDARRVRQHRDKLRKAGYLKPLEKKRGAFPCDQLTEKTLAPLKDKKRWVRVPLELLENRKPSAALMVLGGLLSRGECLDACLAEQDWTYQYAPHYEAVIPSATALAARCGVSPNVVTRELERLQAEGLIDVEHRPRTASGKFVRHRISFSDWPEPTSEEATIPMAKHVIPKKALPPSVAPSTASAWFRTNVNAHNTSTPHARFTGRRHRPLVVRPVPAAAGHAASVTKEPFAQTVLPTRTNGPSRSHKRSEPFAQTVPPSKEAFLGGLSRRPTERRLCDENFAALSGDCDQQVGEESRKHADAPQDAPTTTITARTTPQPLTTTTPCTTPQDAPRKPLRTRQEILAADPSELMTATVDASQEAAARDALLASIQQATEAA